MTIHICDECKAEMPKGKGYRVHKSGNSGFGWTANSRARMCGNDDCHVCDLKCLCNWIARNFAEESA